MAKLRKSASLLAIASHLCIAWNSGSQLKLRKSLWLKPDSSDLLQIEGPAVDLRSYVPAPAVEHCL
jgi:hypothetical protein